MTRIKRKTEVHDKEVQVEMSESRHQ